MASIHKDIPLDASPNDVWDAVRDFGALHTRLVPGFVTDTKLDGDARIVTFASGTVARELLVDCDDARRRLAYAIAANERVRHYAGTVQVLADGATRSRVIWTVDVLPERNRALYLVTDGPRRAGDAEETGTQRRMISPFLDALGADGPQPTAPARWIYTAVSSAPGILMSGNSPTTARTPPLRRMAFWLGAGRPRGAGCLDRSVTRRFAPR